MSGALRATITGLGRFVPERVITNHDLERMVETSDEWIRTRTGIVERHVCDASTGTSELAVRAAQSALEDAGVEPADVDFVLVTTATGDMPFPATASLVQDRIGASRAGACDVSAGCTGFIYGLTMGAQMVSAGLYRKVLVVGADSLSKLTDWTDRNTCVLFGDGAGAALLEPARDGYGLLSFVLGSDGAGADLLKVPAGGSLQPASAETVAARQHYIQMAGSEVFKFAVKVVADTTLDVLERAGLAPGDVDLFVPHQANVRIIDAAVKRLGLAEERVLVNLDRYGNTSCASIPMALSEAQDRGLLREGSVVVMCGFGAGLSWGGAAMRWSRVRREAAARTVAATSQPEPRLVG